jgi:hypothetical protein
MLEGINSKCATCTKGCKQFKDCYPIKCKYNALTTTLHNGPQLAVKASKRHDRNKTIVGHD